MHGGRTQWIEGTLELAVVVAEARNEMPDHHGFSRWLQRHGLEQIHPNDRSALVGFSKDLTVARSLLENSKSISWRVIWENRPKQANAALTKIGRGRISPRSQHDASGASKRRRNTIPDVMREDHVPGTRSRSEPLPSRRRQRPAPEIMQEKQPAPVRKGVILKGLTREQVDPDFKGTSIEFATKYGHVNLKTKQQIEQTKRQEELMAWIGLVSDHERTARVLLAATVDPDTLRQWMSKPAKAEKLRTWLSNIERACESLRKCEPDK
jgi:hypothetical protein